MNPQLALLAWRSRRLLLAVAGLLVCMFLGLVALVMIAIGVTPLAPKGLTEEYKRATETMPIRGVPYELLMAVDAVRLGQDWSKVTPATIQETSKLFYTCAGARCNRHSFDDVLSGLGFTAEQREQAHLMVSTAAGAMGGGGVSGCLGFTPNPAAAYAWPVSGPLTACFGMRDNPTEPGSEEMHWGVDIAAPSGTPVRAATAGRVVMARVSGGYGNLSVLVSPDGQMVTWYGHLSRYAVMPGQTVAQGEVIGYVGSTGRSTGPHLHFEMRPNGANPVDPTRYFR